MGEWGSRRFAAPCPALHSLRYAVLSCVALPRSQPTLCLPLPGRLSRRPGPPGLLSRSPCLPLGRSCLPRPCAPAPYLQTTPTCLRSGTWCSSSSTARPAGSCATCPPSTSTQVGAAGLGGWLVSFFSFASLAGGGSSPCLQLVPCTAASADHSRVRVSTCCACRRGPGAGGVCAAGPDVQLRHRRLWWVMTRPLPPGCSILPCSRCCRQMPPAAGHPCTQLLGIACSLPAAFRCQLHVACTVPVLT
jgi:hypothetical protein